MALMTLISQDLSQGIQPYVADVNAALQALGPVGIQDVIVTRREGMQRRVPKLSTTVSYVSPGPLSFRAASFLGRSGADVDASAIAFFAANPTYRAHFIRDVGDDRRGSLVPNGIMVVYATQTLSNCGYNRSRIVVVQALAPIAAGASGSAQVVGVSGLLAGQTLTVVNRSDTSWSAGARGYASLRNGTCVWDGFKTCCDAAAPPPIED